MTGHPVRPASLAELRELVGRELGPSDWQQLGQERIDQFAALTGDNQWIHVDPIRASGEPLGTTIAHGLFSLSLGPAFGGSLLSLDSFAHVLNYGFDRVRFPAPVPVNSRLRMRLTVLAVDPVAEGTQLRIQQVFEREGSTKPAAVAQAICRIVDKRSP